MVNLNDKIKLLEAHINNDSNNRVDDKIVIDEDETEEEKITSKRKAYLGNCIVPGCDGKGNINP